MGKTLKQVNIQVEGISCTGCATDIETILRNTDGILDAKVIYATGMIKIEYDPSEIKTDQIFSIVKKIGFNIKTL
ncbi:MAG: heavy metal-associated domain-containing protein [Nitrospirota bacterium]